MTKEEAAGFPRSLGRSRDFLQAGRVVPGGALRIGLDIAPQIGRTHKENIYPSSAAMARAFSTASIVSIWAKKSGAVSSVC